jgi:hypothetical protein
VSRLYFHTEHGDAELWGGEFHHLRLLCKRIAIGILNLDGRSAETIIQLIEPGHYLKHDYRVSHLKWRSSTEVYLRTGEDFLTWNGHRIDTTSLILNTAITAGSGPVILAARLAGQGPLHAHIEGIHRHWLARVIDEGLAAGVFRRGIRPQNADGTLDTLIPCGWDQVRDLLDASDDEPVVTSYSVDCGFPNRHIAGWRPPPGTDLTPRWAIRDPAGWNELTETAKGEYRDETALEMWGALPAADQWRHAMTGLYNAPGRRLLDPLDWETYRFGHGLSMLDLTEGDWRDRLDAAFTTGTPAVPPVLSP